MSSFIYKSCLDGITKGRLNFAKDKFKTLLVDGYLPDPNHRYRSDITSEAGGNGYPPGGVSISVTVEGSKVSFDGFTLEASTLKASGAVTFKEGGSPMLDLLVFYVDFGEEVESRDGPFVLTDSILRLET